MNGLTAFSLPAAMKRKRIDAGLTMRALAKLIGVGFATISRIERGAGSPSPETMLRITKWIADGTGSPTPERSPVIKPWHLKIEERLAALEDWRAREDKEWKP